jgi:hypothetical protein
MATAWPIDETVKPTVLKGTLASACAAPAGVDGAALSVVTDAS